MADATDPAVTDRAGLLTLAAVAVGIGLPYLAVWLAFEAFDSLEAPQAFNAAILGLSGIVMAAGARIALPSWTVLLGRRDFRRFWLALAPVLLFAANGLGAHLQGEGAEAAAEVTSDALAAGEFFSPAAFVLMLAMAGLLVPVAEELAFRGVLYPWLRGRMGVQAAILVSGCLFGVCHVQPDLALRAAVLGMVLAFIRERSGSLWPCIAAHAANNSLAVVVHQLARFL
jgi:membrane protease YdiL (CAAX protease family)